MDQDSHPLVLGFGPLGYSKMVGKSIDKRALEMPVAGMDDHSGLLVDQKQVVVFIDDVQRNILGQDLESSAPVGHHEADHVSRPDDEIGLGHLVVDSYIALLDGALHSVPGCVLQMAGHVLVHPHGGLSYIDIEPEMLEHSLLFVFYSLLRVAEILLLVHFLLLVRFVLLQ